MTSLLSAGLLAAALVGLFELAAFLRTQPGLPAWAGCLTGVAAAPLAWAAFARWGPLIPAASTWPVLVVAESFWLPPPCYAGSAALSLAGAAVTGGAARPATLGALALVAAGAGLPAWRHRVAAGAALTAAALTADGLLLGLPAGLEGALVALPVAAYVLAHRRRAEALRRARRAAEHDPVTDALTRAGLAEWRGQWRRPPSGSVVVLDPDDLRAVQETYGRATAEAVLAGAAFLLRHLLGPREVLARPAGDLLEVWSPAAQDSESARHLALRLHAAVSARPLPTPAGLVRCRWSAGWAAGALSEDLALEAERAAQAARLAGGGRVAGPPDAVPGPAAAGGPSWLVEAARALWQEWPVGAALTDPDGRVLTANPAFQARSGRSWPRLLGRALPEDLPLTPPQAVRVGDRLAAYWVTLAGAEAAPLLPAPAAALDWLARPGFAADPRWTVTPLFQAIVTLPAGQLLAFEALSRPRWDGRPLDPETLFHQAAGLGLTTELDLACLRALRDALASRSWPADALLFVNVNPTTLNRPAEAGPLLEALAALVGPGRLVVEISEHVPADLPDGFWGRLRGLYPGVIWAQDDYGRGEADVLRLVSLDPDWVKLDRALVLAALAAPAGREWLAWFADWLQNRHGRHLIAEGVEEASQAEALAALGVGAAQGYLWGRPCACLRQARAAADTGAAG